MVQVKLLYKYLVFIQCRTACAEVISVAVVEYFNGYEREKSSGHFAESCGLLRHSRRSWEYTLVSCGLKSLEAGCRTVRQGKTFLVCYYDGDGRLRRIASVIMG